MMASGARTAGERQGIGSTKEVDLVFEGGGLKGIGLVGAYSVLEEHRYHPQNTAGSSAGAIVAAGYTASELRGLIRDIDFRGLEDRIRKTRFPILPDVISLLKERGICEGEALHAWISDLLATKGVRTFSDLLRRPAAEEFLATNTSKPRL